MKQQLLLLLTLVTWSVCGPSPVQAHAPQARNVAVTSDGASLALALPGFGVVMRERTDKPFVYLCDALLEHAPSDAVPSLAFLADGSLLLGTSDGVRIVAPRGCPGPRAKGFLANAQIMGMAVHPSADTGGDVAYAASAGDLPAFWRSVDGGQTWQQRSTLANAQLLNALRVSTDDANVVYLSSGTDAESTLLASTDGGATFADFAEAGGFTLLQASKDRLWALARSDDNTTNRGFDVLRAEAPQGPWTAVLRVNYFGGFALDGQGVVWVGDESGGLHRSDDDGETFVDVAPERAVSCLAAVGDSLWACAPGTNVEPALVQQPASSKPSDEASFAPVVALADVDQLVRCDADTDVPTRCAAAWVEWERDVRMESSTSQDGGAAQGAADAGAEFAADAETAGSGGDVANSGCSVAAAGGARGSSTMPQWLGFAGLALALGARRTARRAA